jgi:hypothetical protein
MTKGVGSPNAETRRARVSPLFCLAPALLFLSCSEIRAADPGDQSYTPVDFADRWSGWGGIGGYYGTDQSSYGVLTLFLPLAQTPDSLFFTEIDGK